MSAVASRAYKFKHEKDPKEVIYEKLSGWDSFIPNGSDYLVAIYQRPPQLVTDSGIIIHVSDNSSKVTEDEFQGIVGLVIRKGPNAGDYDKRFKNPPQEGDWVVFRPADTWPFKIGKCAVRLVGADMIRGQVSDPDSVV